MKAKTFPALALLILMALLVLSASAEDAPDTVTYDRPEVYFASNYELDNDACYDGYVRTLLEMPLPEADIFPKRPPMTFTGVEKSIYDILNAEIAKIAAGQRSSTQIEVPLSVFNLKSSYTAADLGVSTIFDSNGQFTDEAINAIYGLIDKDYDAMVDMLLADNPYEMYWFNKDSSSCWGIEYPSIGASTSGGKTTVRFADEPLTFKFEVSQDYRADQYTVDTSNVDRVNRAIANAQKIITQHADKDNYEKLLAYKVAICDLVSYNDDAANKYNNTPYGDPWQLVWVFDDDSATKVVCEGYSKAFQYLCDHSAFQGSVNCICVTGSIGGDHMWNVVQMHNGKNYLVDVTNCDTGTIGAPDKLFLAGCANGSPATGYQFPFDITFTYDAETRALYSTALLTLSSKGYLEETAPEPVTITDILYLPSDLKTVEPNAFAGIAAQKVVVPSGCTSIGDHAFANCQNLVEVQIPSSVTTIHDDAFAGCGKLSIVSGSGQIVAWADSHGFIGVGE